MENTLSYIFGTLQWYNGKPLSLEGKYFISEIFSYGIKSKPFKLNWTQKPKGKHTDS